jgi:hypothetical protein
MAPPSASPKTIAMGSGLALGVLAAMVSPARAVCTLPGTGTNCGRFDASTASVVFTFIQDPNLNPDNYLQMGFRASAPNVLIRDIGYSFQSGGPFLRISQLLNTGANPGAYTFTPIIKSAHTSIASDTIFLNYTIARNRGLQANRVVTMAFMANSDGSEVPAPISKGVLNAKSILTDNINPFNDYINVTRGHRSIGFREVPAPLPLLGAGWAFVQSRRLRRRITTCA